MSPIEVPAKIQLVEKRETRTSRGMLSKGWYHVDDQLVMVKGNSITEAGTAGYEPYSEVMASLIAQVLPADLEGTETERTYIHDTRFHRNNPGISGLCICHNDG